jgi:hypothetical protein
MLSDTMPYVAEQLYATLICQQKPGGGLQPIAVAETWLHIVGPLQMAV